MQRAKFCSADLFPHVMAALACQGGKWVDAWDEADAEALWKAVRRLHTGTLFRYRTTKGTLKLVLFDREVTGVETRDLVWETEL